MLEKEIEKELVKSVKNRGGLCIKMNSLSMSGLPDRLILMKSSKIGFVELKRKGKKPRSIQLRRIKQMKELGVPCFVLDDKEQIGGILDAICTTSLSRVC